MDALVHAAFEAVKTAVEKTANVKNSWAEVEAGDVLTLIESLPNPTPTLRELEIGARNNAAKVKVIQEAYKLRHLLQRFPAGESAL